MKIKKRDLEVLSNVINATEGILSLAESRIRDTFAKPLKEVTDTMIADREKIYVKFCMNKEDGSPDLTTNNQFQFKNEVVEDLYKEIDILLQEEVEINHPATFKAILEQTTYKPKINTRRR